MELALFFLYLSYYFADEINGGVFTRTDSLWTSRYFANFTPFYVFQSKFHMPKRLDEWYNF